MRQNCGVCSFQRRRRYLHKVKVRYHHQLSGQYILRYHLCLCYSCSNYGSAIALQLFQWNVKWDVQCNCCSDIFAVQLLQWHVGSEKLLQRHFGSDMFAMKVLQWLLRLLQCNCCSETLLQWNCCSEIFAVTFAIVAVQLLQWNCTMCNGTIWAPELGASWQSQKSTI